MSGPGDREPLRIGIAGLGTVGAAVIALLRDRREMIAARAGRELVVTSVCARDRHRDRGVDLSAMFWHEDPAALAEDPDVDVVVELIGGAEGPARQLAQRTLQAGRPLVTANKALLAMHIGEMVQAAERTGAPLAFEAAVAGGIPAIKGVREGLAANRIEAVFGILNGTCNYILSEMRATGRDFGEVLREAQRLGYAEADPSFDIDGVDAAHKLVVLASLAFDTAVRFSDLHIEGIRRITAADIAFAEELGYRIKLLGIARRGPEGLSLRVHPCMIARDSSVASVEGVDNAVVAWGDSVGQVMMTGPGAGGGPTASAVVADLIDLARGQRVAPLGAPLAALGAVPTVPMERRSGAYYLRLMVVDRPGVIADIAAAMRDEAISVESLIQRGRSQVEAVPVVITTHDTEEAAMRRALAAIESLHTVLEPPHLIRIESL